MPILETYKKQAKQLLRWHRDRNYSVGGRIRQLPRYHDVTDHESLALNFKLTEAQEIIALEAGYGSWAALRAAAEFYRDRLGLRVDFLHGHPPFYGSVSRACAALHLRFVHEPVLAADTAREEGLIMAFIEARNVKELYAEYLAAGVELAQKLTKHAWGGTDLTVRQLDGNTVAFVG
ncbi:hypothetical protein EV649_5784 [Kribbella sp. VKM Ac-2569]|uniref:VOC family protein n=1 Tax=Kribbella sp. VKM Ac-2569 TaxID=2512220 RepID=UPI00102CAEFF|nr:VOC family protein [Kribbella sp. VKM Ac-2569]RZT15003.1 hypothetical protein EV649_5784 [Kribbella sp. VKM Ac-2569]